MTAPDLAQMIAAGLLLLPALVYGSIALVASRSAFGRMRGEPVIWVVTALMVLVALYFFGGALLALLPPDAGSRPPLARSPVATLRDVCLILAMALSNHVAPLSDVRGEAPRAGWMGVNYGVVALVAALAVWPGAIPLATPADCWLASRVVVLLYLVGSCVFGLRQMGRMARRGGWRLGGLGELRRADVVWGAGNGLALLVMVVLGWVGETAARSPLWIAVAVTALGLAQTVPYAVRFMSEGARVFFATLALLAVTVAAYVGARALTPGAGLERDLATLVALFIVLVPGQAWVRRRVDWIFFRRSRRQHAELQAVLQRVSPELGVLECCRRALPDALRVIQLRGVGLLLRDGETVVCGDFDIESVKRVWPLGEAADALPRRAFGGPEFRTLPAPLAEAMIEAQVSGVLPIASPRRRWGDMFCTAGLMTAIYSEEDVQVWEAFAAQFALVLDAAELIARAVAVERSLAHAEKLAAIGELTARIAHEIRNPVTAARSLAQQLSREPASPFHAEHEVILGELERVERQVAELLRFARRDELRFAPVDLGRLVRATVDDFRPRLEAAGIEVALEAADGVTAHADGEKLRQVVINLVENAIDALGDANGARRLAIAVAGANGRVTMRVADSGPGVPADALPHLFEPFFSLKASGTGLGLAIVRRTIEAHDGRIEAYAPAGEGMAFAIELPAGREAEEGHAR